MSLGMCSQELVILAPYLFNVSQAITEADTKAYCRFQLFKLGENRQGILEQLEWNNIAPY